MNTISHDQNPRKGRISWTLSGARRRKESHYTKVVGQEKTLHGLPEQEGGKRLFPRGPQVERGLSMKRNSISSEDWGLSAARQGTGVGGRGGGGEGNR